MIRLIAQRSRHSWVGALLFFVWLALVVAQALQHVMWRDEVRALSIALSGDGWLQMLQNLHGEGHPALWYLLLRAGHDISGRVEILEILSVAIAAAAAALLTWRAPFNLTVKALILFGFFLTYEYSVSARNYGLGMLLLFAVAACYRRRRENGVVLGVLLFLLANTNLIATALSGAFLLFWLIDILTETGPRWTPALKTFFLNAVLASFGAGLCLFTVLPTYNDAAVALAAGPISPADLLQAALLPAGGTLGALVRPIMQGEPGNFRTILLGSLVLFGGAFGLLRRTGALVAAVVSLAALAIFFQFGAHGDYRHAAQWLCLLIALYWIEADRATQALPATQEKPESLLARSGALLFLLLLAMQIVPSAGRVESLLQGAPSPRPGREFGAFLAERPDLSDAILIADPDYLLEALPYYATNKAWLIRESRYGDVVRFTRDARLTLSLDDIRETAARLRRETGKPVLILLHEKLDDLTALGKIKEGYNWTLTLDGEQAARFRRDTTYLRRFAPGASDESFDLFLAR